MPAQRVVAIPAHELLCSAIPLPPGPYVFRRHREVSPTLLLVLPADARSVANPRPGPTSPPAVGPLRVDARGNA